MVERDDFRIAQGGGFIYELDELGLHWSPYRVSVFSTDIIIN
jgi:hypothetical protein